MKKTLLLIFAFFAASFLSSTENGFLFSSDTDLRFYSDKTEDREIIQKIRFTPYFKRTLEQGLYFTAEGFLQYKLDSFSGAKTESENDFIVDVTLLKLNSISKFSGTGYFQLAFGRMEMADATGIIFNQTNDGLLMRLANSHAELTMHGGYTGAQNLKDVSILLSTGEIWKKDKDDEKKVYDCTPPYISASLSLSFPRLLGNTTVTFEGLGFFPAKGISKISDNEKQRLYGTFMLSGALNTAFFRTLVVSFETNEFDELAMYARYDWSFLLPKNATFGLFGSYASGKNGDLVPFVGFTKTSALLSTEEFLYSGLVKGGLSLSFVLAKKVFVQTQGFAAFDVKDTNKDETTGEYNDPKYLGIDAGLSVKWQIFADLKLVLSASRFFANEKEDSRMRFMLGGEIAF